LRSLPGGFAFTTFTADATEREDMMKRSSLLAVAALLAACTTKDNAGSDSAGTTTGARSDSASVTAERIGETDGLSTPESVRYDADQDVFFVSNIDGNPSQKDGKGSIRKVRADSLGAATMFIEGGKNRVTLNAPKGIALQGDTLWVADIDAVRGFDKRTGAPVATIDLRSQKATFLNDVVVGGDGALYVTDTGISFAANGEMSQAGVKRIFKIAGRAVTEAASGDSLRNPNGLAWDAANNRFVLAPFSGADLFSWTPGAGLTHVASGPGQYDGVEVVDGMVLVSSWADSSVQVVRGGSHQTTKLISGVNGPADIGFDTKRRVIAVPMFNDGKVGYYRLH
jgi:sugar lactone lactonase YvrE